MHDIFISYAHEDKPRARQLVDLFEQQGWSVWWDELIKVGTKYSAILDEALSQSRCVIVIWTKDSLQSEYVRSEAHRGDARAALVQVMLEEVLLPSPFNEFAIADLTQWPDHERGHQELKKLIRDVGGRLTLASTSIPVDTSSYIPGFGGRPAVAVLPFNNSTGDVDMEYILDGVSTDIIDRLQRFRSFPVISSFTMANVDFSNDPAAVAQQLGVQYLVSGILRKVGSEFRIRIELTKAPMFETVWSTTNTLGDFDSTTLQDDLSLSIAAQLQPEIERSARQAALPIQHEDADTWHLVRQGIWHQYKLSREGARESYTCLTRALERDADSSEALVQLAWWHFWDISFRRGEQEEWSTPEGFARRAANIDPNDSRPVTMIGIANMMRGQHDEARNYYQQAIKLNPSHVWPYAHMGSSLYLDGQPEASIVYSNKALRLSPQDLFSFHAYCDIAASNYLLGDFSSALDAANYSLGQRGGYWLAHVIKICTLVKMGREASAEKAVLEMELRKPNLSRRDLEWIMFTDRGINTELLDEMTKAGWKQ